MNIGDWVRRPRGKSKWHLVDSTVADRAVTRCGREMHRQNRSGGELQVSEVMPLTRMIGQPQLCKGGCDRTESSEHHEPGVLEDDASTTVGVDTHWQFH